MKKTACFILTALMTAGTLMAQDPIADGIIAVTTIAGETKLSHETTLETAVSQSNNENPDSTVQVAPVVAIPVWKQKLYYGYNFDIYYHHDTRTTHNENGFSIALTPEIGWRLKERLHIGLRFGGSYANLNSNYSVAIPGFDTTYTTQLRVHQGSWEITPYARYRLKTIFNDRLGIWIEAHLYTGMEFPRVAEGNTTGTDYEGLRYSITYGFQISPVITYQFNKKSTFQIFFSILSIGYSGTTFCKTDELGKNYNEYTNDVIIFSGKLRNLIANQFTPGLYGFKLGIQKSF